MLLLYAAVPRHLLAETQATQLDCFAFALLTGGAWDKGPESLAVSAVSLHLEGAFCIHFGPS